LHLGLRSAAAKEAAAIDAAKDEIIPAIQDARAYCCAAEIDVFEAVTCDRAAGGTAAENCLTTTGDEPSAERQAPRVDLRVAATGDRAARGTARDCNLGTAVVDNGAAAVPAQEPVLGT
jgi:hypothetical protein